MVVSQARHSLRPDCHRPTLGEISLAVASNKRHTLAERDRDENHCYHKRTGKVMAHAKRGQEHPEQVTKTGSI